MPGKLCYVSQDQTIRNIQSNGEELEFVIDEGFVQGGMGLLNGDISG